MKKYLLIDGEFYEKQIKEYCNLEEIIEKYFGILTKPDKIIYYGASVCDEKKKKLKEIPNIEFNEKGYLIKKEGKKILQKGVDGYIISDLTDMTYQNDIGLIVLISGDGDMKAGVEKIYERKNIKIQVIGTRDTISKEIEEFCDFHFVEDIFEKKKEKVSDEVVKDNELDENIYESEENFQILIQICDFLKEKKKELSMSNVGINAKKYGFKYPDRNLYTLLQKFEEQGKLTLTKIKKDNRITIIK